MVEMLAQHNLGLGEIARMLPGRNGKPLSESTIKNWIVRGVPTTGGERIKLAAMRVGSRWAISRQDLEEFLGRQNAATACV